MYWFRDRHHPRSMGARFSLGSLRDRRLCRRRRTLRLLCQYRRPPRPNHRTSVRVLRYASPVRLSRGEKVTDRGIFGQDFERFSRAWGQRFGETLGEQRNAVAPLGENDPVHDLMPQSAEDAFPLETAYRHDCVKYIETAKDRKPTTEVRVRDEANGNVSSTARATNCGTSPSSRSIAPSAAARTAGSSVLTRTNSQGLTQAIAPPSKPFTRLLQAALSEQPQVPSALHTSPTPPSTHC